MSPEQGAQRRVQRAGLMQLQRGKKSVAGAASSTLWHWLAKCIDQEPDPKFYSAALCFDLLTLFDDLLTLSKP
jgi:hypothetical protein